MWKNKKFNFTKTLFRSFVGGEFGFVVFSIVYIFLKFSFWLHYMSKSLGFCLCWSWLHILYIQYTPSDVRMCIFYRWQHPHNKSCSQPTSHQSRDWHFNASFAKKTIFSMLKNVLIRSFHLFSSFIKTGSSIIFGVNEFQIWMHVKQIYMCVEKNQGHFISTRLKGWYCDTYLFILHSCVSNPSWRCEMDETEHEYKNCFNN